MYKNLNNIKRCDLYSLSLPYPLPLNPIQAMRLLLEVKVCLVFTSGERKGLHSSLCIARCFSRQGRALSHPLASVFTEPCQQTHRYRSHCHSRAACTVWFSVCLVLSQLQGLVFQPSQNLHTLISNHYQGWGKFHLNSS